MAESGWYRSGSAAAHSGGNLGGDTMGKPRGERLFHGS
jgi:hypothetical protein